MSVLIRCAYCSRFFSVSKGAVVSCPKCGKYIKHRAYYVDFRTLDGKQARQYAGSDLVTARKMDADLKANKKLGKLSQEYRPAKQTTFRSFMEHSFLPHFEQKNKGKKPAFIFNYLLDVFSDKPLKDITPANVESALLSKWGDKKTAFNYGLAIIRRIFNYAIELEVVEHSPVKVKKLFNDNSRLRFLTVQEQARLLEACKSSNSPFLYDMVFIALHTGLRLGEIQTLSRENVTEEGVTVLSEYSKNKRSRFIPLSPLAVEFFKNASFDYKHDIKNGFKVALRKANIENFHFHDLRHTYASRLVQAGVALQEVKELLGHQTLTMTMRYAHLSKDNLKRAVAKLDEANKLLRVV